MRASTARIALAAAGLAVVGVVSASQAATPVGPKSAVVSDPSGDSFGAPGDDIVKVTYVTSGTTTKVGKKLVYTPKVLNMTLEIAKAMPADGSVMYQVNASTAGCSDFLVNVAPGAISGDFLYAYCSDDESVDAASVSYAVSGSTLTFSIPLKAVPGIAAGASITGLAAYAGSVEPVLGLGGPMGFDLRELANDTATSDATYKIG